ncbi:MAG: hypothetical protein AAF663_11830 [Planctomycetota bacterium]
MSMSWRPPSELPIPSANDIGSASCLDEASALRNFLGKSHDQAVALFQDNFLYYQEDLMWMRPAGFGFYIYAAVEYLVSADADDDSDAANTFVALIEWWLDEDPEAIAPVRGLLRDACLEVISEFPRFNAEPDIYGNLKNRYILALQQLKDGPHKTP